MRGTKVSSERLSWANLAAMVAASLLFILGFAAHSKAQQEGQKTFSSAEEASQALLAATQNNDEKSLLEIFGPDGKQIVSSGDDAEDAQNRANFAQKFQEMHRLVKEPDGTTTLYIGAENWPTPIPLVSRGDVWYFDTNAGKQEILYRRIGENELSTIRVCQELEAAEKEYSAAQHGELARQIFSDEGKHNGLYWKAADSQPQSPIGPLVAAAFIGENAGAQEGGPTPFRGYYFRILVHEVKTASGPVKVSFLAYPAEYGSSGVMTFLVDRDGVVYQKDLGKKTDELAKAIKPFSSHAGWQKSEGQQEEASSDTKSNR